MANETVNLECLPSISAIEQSLQDAYIPGLVAIVVNSTDILYEQAFGYHSPIPSNKRQPMDPFKSIFVLASISKTFIAVAVMQLVELNSLNLDTDINSYLSPRMKINHPLYPTIPITMRHLLSHTAGIGTNFLEELERFQPNDDFLQTNLDEIITKYLNNTSYWLNESPGNVTSYSNIGICLAAFIVEHLSNISFEEYVQDKILIPLGISRNEASYRISNFEHRTQDLVEHFIHNSSWLEKFQTYVPQLHVTQVDNSSDWLYIPPYGATDYPTGFLRMSAHSLAIYLQAFLNNFPSLLHHSSSIEEMLKIVRHEQSDVEYGLIWNWKTIGGRRFIGHRGAVPGITNIMMTNENRTLGVIILSNGDITKEDDQAKKVYETITNIMLKLFDCFEKNWDKTFT